MSAIRPVFYVSDGTGITAETIGHSLLTQFSDFQFLTDRLAFVDDPDKAREASERIHAAGLKHGVRPIVVNSCVDVRLSMILTESGALMLDVFAPFIEPLERELEQPRQARVGRAHGMVDFETYHRRINAMNYSLAHDDGMAFDYDEADVILVGVSRAGKTPTCVYLALHYGVKAANYPLTDGDLESDRLPPRLKPWRRKLFGLTIDPERLQQIRHGNAGPIRATRRWRRAAARCMRPRRCSTWSGSRCRARPIPRSRRSRARSCRRWGCSGKCSERRGRGWTGFPKVGLHAAQVNAAAVAAHRVASVACSRSPHTTRASRS